MVFWTLFLSDVAVDEGISGQSTLRMIPHLRPLWKGLTRQRLRGKGTAQNASSLAEQDDLGKERVAGDLAAICIKGGRICGDAAQRADINKLSARCPENRV